MRSAQHGTRSRYVRGCRCEPCINAQRTYSRERLDAARRRRHVDHQLRDVAPLPPAMHGRLSTYKNHACRCETCTTAARTYARDYARRRSQPACPSAALQ